MTMPLDAREVTPRSRGAEFTSIAAPGLIGPVDHQLLSAFIFRASRVIALHRFSRSIGHGIIHARSREYPAHQHL